MAKKSAGILVYRQKKGILEVLLVHPGGPFYKNKDAGVWTIPKGEYEEGEEPLAAARREFEEETGLELSGHFETLTPIKQRSGKIVTAYAVEADLEVANILSNVFSLEWPPKSGKMQEFPEIDRAAWHTVADALQKILPAQTGLITELESRIKK